MEDVKEFIKLNTVKFSDDSGCVVIDVSLLENKLLEIQEKYKEREDSLVKSLGNHVHIDCDEFRELMNFVMVNDEPNDCYDVTIVNSVLDQIAIKTHGFDDWIQAYHRM